MKIRYTLKHILFRFSRAFYHARKFFAVFGLCLILVVCMFSAGIVASADTVYGITIPEEDTLDQVVDPDYNDKFADNYWASNPSVYSDTTEGVQGDMDSLLDQQQSGLVSMVDYIESFVDLLTSFQASFFGFIEVFDSFVDIPVLSFLLYASLAVGLMAFLLGVLPALISSSEAASRRKEAAANAAARRKEAASKAAASRKGAS